MFLLLSTPSQITVAQTNLKNASKKTQTSTMVSAGGRGGFVKEKADVGGGGDEGSMLVTLRTGLWVSIDEADTTDDDVLIMLSKV